MQLDKRSQRDQLAAVQECQVGLPEVRHRLLLRVASSGHTVPSFQPRGWRPTVPCRCWPVSTLPTSHAITTGRIQRGLHGCEGSAACRAKHGRVPATPPAHPFSPALCEAISQAVACFLFPSFLHEGLLVIVMEWASGGSLHAAICRSPRPLPEEAIWRVLLHISLALHHMHTRRAGAGVGRPKAGAKRSAARAAAGGAPLCTGRFAAKACPSLPRTAGECCTETSSP